MKTPQPMRCASCDEGSYHVTNGVFEGTLPDGSEIKVPNITVLRCDKCGDELLTPDSQKRIDREIADQTEQLTCAELEELAGAFNLNQTEISQALGLGTKTYHRWLAGTQYPSRSMGYYLRVMAKFPDAFQWVKDRGWRRATTTFRGCDDTKILFPEIGVSQSFTNLTLIDLGQYRDSYSAARQDSSSRGINVVRLFRETKVA